MRWFGIRFRATLTDNEPFHRSRLFAQLCRQPGLEHRFTRPYAARTNGKTERLIRTVLEE
jgi:transposase